MVDQVEARFFFGARAYAEADGFFHQHGQHVSHDEGVGDYGYRRQYLRSQQSTACFCTAEATRQTNPYAADEARYQVDAEYVERIVVAELELEFDSQRSDAASYQAQ